MGTPASPEYLKKWISDNPERFRMIHRRSRWKQQGISMTEQEYQERWTKQNGRCKICLTSQEKLKHKLSVDHDHLTGRTRGLLCSKCNQGLGLFQESRILIENALKYLREN